MRSRVRTSGRARKHALLSPFPLREEGREDGGDSDKGGVKKVACQRALVGASVSKRVRQLKFSFYYSQACSFSNNASVLCDENAVT